MISTNASSITHCTLYRNNLLSVSVSFEFKFCRRKIIKNMESLFNPTVLNAKTAAVIIPNIKCVINVYPIKKEAYAPAYLTTSGSLSCRAI